MPTASVKPAVEVYLADRRARIDHALQNVLPPAGAPPLLRDAVTYSLTAGGKRIRPILALAACEAVGGSVDRSLPLVLSLEMVHTYSLVHDDLPAMDDDDLRRGRPTSHRVFGEDVAILAGDVLQAMAFGLLADPARGEGVASDARLASIAELAEAAGAEGLVGGQVLDLRAEAPPAQPLGDEASRATALAKLDDIHRRKTGALIRAAVRIGAILGGASADQLTALTRYGDAIGLLFQIADDVLDVEATTEQMGKATRKDGDQRKWAYPTVIGLDASRAVAETWVAEAVDALSDFSDAADPLRGIARYILDRRS